MKFKDIAYVVLIIVAFGILHLTGFYYAKIERIRRRLA